MGKDSAQKKETVNEDDVHLELIDDEEVVEVELGADEKELVMARRRALAWGSLAAGPASRLPIGVAESGQPIYNTEDQRRAKRLEEREQRRRGLRR